MKSVLIMAPHFLNTAKSSRIVWVDTIWPFIHIRKGERVAKVPPIDEPKDTLAIEPGEMYEINNNLSPRDGVFIVDHDWVSMLRKELKERGERPIPWHRKSITERRRSESDDRRKMDDGGSGDQHSD